MLWRQYFIRYVCNTSVDAQCELSWSLHWPDWFSPGTVEPGRPSNKWCAPLRRGNYVWSPVSVCIIKSASMWSVQPAMPRVGTRQDRGNEGIFFLFFGKHRARPIHCELSDNIGADYDKYTNKLTNCLQATWLWWSGTAYSSATLYSLLETWGHVYGDDTSVLSQQTAGYGSTDVAT